VNITSRNIENIKLSGNITLIFRKYIKLSFRNIKKKIYSSGNIDITLILRKYIKLAFRNIKVVILNFPEKNIKKINFPEEKYKLSECKE